MKFQVISPLNKKEVVLIMNLNLFSTPFRASIAVLDSDHLIYDGAGIGSGFDFGNKRIHM